MQCIRPLIIVIFSLFSMVAVAQTSIRTVHETQKGETLLSISEYYSVSLDDLIAVNPELKAKPKKKLKSGYLINIPERKSNKAVVKDTFSVAVVLPLTVAGKESERCLEFYRGLLMAADQQRENGQIVKVTAIEEPAAKSDFSAAVTALQQVKPDVIVGPLYPTHFDAVSEFAQSQKVKTIIPFSSKVKDVDNNPYLYLLNTPLAKLQEDSYQLFRKNFKGRRCVLIRTQDGTNAAVVNYLLDKMTSQNSEVHTLSQGFTRDDFMHALSSSIPNVIVLDGSDKANVVPILKQIHEFTGGAKDYKLSVIGHNEWQEFSMEHCDLLNSLDTYVLANDFYDAHDKQVIAFEDTYHKWFKTYPLMLHPRMGELGYDTGLYLFTASVGDSKVDRKGNAIDYLQSQLSFEKLSRGGYVNSCIMFLHFESGNTPEILE